MSGVLKDLATCEQGFREAVEKLPDYKRRQAWDYVEQLNKRLAICEAEKNKIAIGLARLLP
jgi:hypothetical protein